MSDAELEQLPRSRASCAAVESAAARAQRSSPSVRLTSGEAPSFMRFESLSEFVEGCMRPDHLEYIDPHD